MGTEATNPGTNSSNEAPDTTASTGVNWADFAVDVDDEGAFIAEPGGEPASSTEVPTSTAPSSAQSSSTGASQPSSQQTPSSTQPQDAPQGQQVQTTQQAAVSQQESAPQTAAPPSAAAPSREELLANYRQSLETGYAISQEDAIALATSPETVLPRLATQVHMRVMEEVSQHFQQMMQMVPQVMEQRLAQQTAETEAKQAFYGAWPGLQAHHDRVVANAALVRQANPQATREQIIEMAGMMTAIALGVDPSTLRGQQAQAQRVQASAQTQRPMSAPHKPAAAGSTPNQLPVQQQNVFANFADEDLDFLKG